MDLVEAIDAWIDERIDDLTDDELEQILEIQDDVSASELADLDIVHVYNDDIYALVELGGGDLDQQNYTEDVLRAAFFGDPFPADTGAPSTDVGEEPVDTINDDTFLRDMAKATAFDDAQQTADHVPGFETPEIQPVPLRAGDALGPSFLPEPVTPQRSISADGWKRSLVGVLMLGALALFAFGSVQLFGALGQTDTTTNEAQRPQAPEEAEADAAPSATSEPTPQATTATPADDAEQSDQTQAEPEQTDTRDSNPVEPAPVPARIGIRLVTGDIMVASFEDAEATADLKLIYDATNNDDLTPARDLIWIEDKVGVIDTDGNVLIVDPDRSPPRPRPIYEVGGGIVAAAEIADVGGAVAIRTVDGDVTLMSTNGRIDADAIQFLWKAEEEELAATDIAGSGTLVPVVFEDGSAIVIDTGDDNATSELWTAEDDESPAFNVGASATELLLGVGQGSVVRVQLDADNETFEVWSPVTENEDEPLPAIGYAPAADRTALVLASGMIRLANEEGYGRTLWDPAVTEIRALALAGSESDVVALLEVGSVVRIPLASSDFIDSIWDITDETLAPANQVAVEVRSAVPES